MAHLVSRRLNIIKLTSLQKCFLSTSRLSRLKEIVYKEEDNVTIIEGVNVKSPREGKVVNLKNNVQACPLCRLGLKNLTHTDVLILSQFIQSDGTVLPQTVTGLCGRQHFKICILVHQAKKAGLLPETSIMPKFPWHFNNTYFKTSL